MTTGGTTWPAENTEAPNRQSQQGTTKIDQVRKMWKYCKQLTQKPQIQEKIKEYHNGRITKVQLEELFKRELSGESADFKKQIWVGEWDGAFETFFTNTKCFENQFMYEITHNTRIKDSAREEMLDGCIETLRDEYHITSSQEGVVREYLRKNESVQWLNIFLESGKKRRKTLKKALPSPLSEKTLDDIDLNGLHSKIANLPPSDSARRIQAIWSTMLGGIRVQEGEDVTAAFRRIQEEGSEWDLTADYEAFFSCPDSLISKENKERIRAFLVRQYAPTISLENLQEIDQGASKKLLAQYQVDTHTEGSPDSDWESAIKAQRDESARQTRWESLVANAISTKNLDTKTQLRILWGLSSARRLKQKNSFARGHVWESSIPGMDYEDTFKNMNGFHPDEVMTDDGLVAKLEEAHGSTIKNLDKFAPGAVMRWKNKGSDGKDMVGYYVIEHTLWNVLSDDGEPGDIKLRFLGNNQNGGRLSRAGIPQTKTGPQFFEYLDRCAEGGEIDFISDGGTLESEELKKTLTADGASFYTDTEAKKELKSRYGGIEIESKESFNEELDTLLHRDTNKARESDNVEQRNLFPGIIFALQSPEENKCDTFQIEEIIPREDGQPGMVHIWDGWGSGPDSRREMTFRDFINHIKEFQKKYSAVFRVPGGKPNTALSVGQFNMLMSSQTHNSESGYKKNKNVCIQDGKLMQFDATGTPTEKTIIKIRGGEKDLHILGINWDTVEVSQGTFTQAKYDEKKGKAQDATFKWTAPRQISLTLLWAYLQNNSGYELDKPRTPVKTGKREEQKPLGWLSIFAHSHSLWVLLHGDLWKAPFKAWEEQHNKDHAFHGKITAALAIEKLQKGHSWPIGGLLNWAEWPSLMVANSNNTFQSYLDELVTMIDGMGSKHRTNLIKKWARSEHFPSAKFMAAMFASMHNFGQLYPYDYDEDDPRSKDSHGTKIDGWFWYTSIVHSVDPRHSTHPHMPPHDGQEWPEWCRNKTTGEPLSEIQACHKLFGEFQHPALTNLGRRFQKYMNKGHENLKDGGKMNMEQRVGMDDRLDWMMRSIVDPGGKPTEIFGAATDIWLAEGYPTEISTMPYMAMMIGQREQQLLPMTQTHAKELFQSGNHVPMFVFCQNKWLWDTFRETSIAFAYTISNTAGKELEDLCAMSSVRLKADSVKRFRKRFESFWKEHGTKMIHKLTGMRDPMLNLMINAPETFDEMLEAMPEWQKKRDYEQLNKRKRHIRGYFDRLQGTYDSPSHTKMERWKAFYTGDHFRFRDSFDVGYPMAWVNWDAYWDSNMDDKYASGGGATDGDGVFNEIRWFLYKIPKMAEKMADDMGFTGAEREKYINKISDKLYHKNIDPMKRLAEQKIKATNPEAEYCSMTAMMFGLIPVQEFTVWGAHAEAHTRYKDYYNKMKAIKEKADSMQESGRVAEAIEYREKMATTWSKIVKQQINVGKCTIEDIENGRFGWSAVTMQAVTSKTLEEFEAKMRPQGSPLDRGNPQPPPQ